MSRRALGKVPRRLEDNTFMSRHCVSACFDIVCPRLLYQSVVGSSRFRFPPIMFMMVEQVVLRTIWCETLAYDWPCDCFLTFEVLTCEDWMWLTLGPDEAWVLDEYGAVLDDSELFWVHRPFSHNSLRTVVEN